MVDRPDVPVLPAVDRRDNDLGRRARHGFYEVVPVGRSHTDRGQHRCCSVGSQGPSDGVELGVHVGRVVVEVDHLDARDRSQETTSHGRSQRGRRLEEPTDPEISSSADSDIATVSLV